MIELHLPYPVSANNLWKRTRNGMRKSDEYVQWLHDAGHLARQQKPKHITGPYKLSIQAVRPDNRKRDLDNLIKGCSDLLVGLSVIPDDSQCEMIVARWVTEGEGVYVRIEPAGVEA